MPPESLRVIHLAPMHQLVNHHIFADEIRHQDQSPIQRDGAASTNRRPNACADCESTRASPGCRVAPQAPAARPAVRPAARSLRPASSGSHIGTAPAVAAADVAIHAAPLHECAALRASIPTAATSRAPSHRPGRARCSGAPSDAARTQGRRRAVDDEPRVRVGSGAVVKSNPNCMERAKDTVK